MICETNQLASNEPNEDELFVTRSKVSDGDVLVGVVDGHGGKGISKFILCFLDTHPSRGTPSLA